MGFGLGVGRNYLCRTEHIVVTQGQVTGRKCLEGLHAGG
jgi:hypothetical protein